MCEVVALIPILAVWIGTDVEWPKKLLLMGVYLVIWSIAAFVTPWAYGALLLYAVFVYFLFFGSGPGKRWRP
jgi:hypothetical protein